MKNSALLFLMLVSSTTLAQTKGSIPANFSEREDTQHFVLLWNEGETRALEIEKAKEYAEEVFGKIGGLFGVANMPSQKLIMTFGGEGVNPETRKKRTPHVDFQGRIHLYRFDMGGYLSVLPHEMVHAIRMNTVAKWDRFFEEGFASAIAYYLYPERAGFPRFGYELDLIAGYWLNSNRGIPLETMRNQHSGLNLKCQLQTYVTREDFFNYLVVNYGMKKMVGFAYAKNVGALALYESTWQKSFEELSKAWEVDLKMRYDLLGNTDQLIEAYFSTTSAKYIPVCQAGVDY